MMVRFIHNPNPQNPEVRHYHTIIVAPDPDILVMDILIICTV